MLLPNKVVVTMLKQFTYSGRSSSTSFILLGQG